MHIVQRCSFFTSCIQGGIFVAAAVAVVVAAVVATAVVAVVTIPHCC